MYNQSFSFTIKICIVEKSKIKQMIIIICYNCRIERYIKVASMGRIANFPKALGSNWNQ